MARRSPWKLYAVKTVYRIDARGRPRGVDEAYAKGRVMVEERIVLFRARSCDEAIEKAEREAREYGARYVHTNPYGQQVFCEFTGIVDAYAPFDPPAVGAELFSSRRLLPKRLDQAALADLFLGPEVPRERALRTKFLNAEFSGTRTGRRAAGPR